MKKILSKEVWRGEGDVFIETKVVYACIYIYMARKQNKIQSSIARRWQERAEFICYIPNIKCWQRHTPPALPQPFLPLKSLFRLGFLNLDNALFILFFGIDLAKRKLKVYCRNFWVQAEWRQLYVIFIQKKKNGKQRSPQLKKTRIYSIHFWNSYKVKKKSIGAEDGGRFGKCSIYIYIFRALIFLLIARSGVNYIKAFFRHFHYVDNQVANLF